MEVIITESLFYNAWWNCIDEWIEGKSTSTKMVRITLPDNVDSYSGYIFVYVHITIGSTHYYGHITVPPEYTSRTDMVKVFNCGTPLHALGTAQGGWCNIVVDPSPYGYLDITPTVYGATPSTFEMWYFFNVWYNYNNVV